MAVTYRGVHWNRQKRIYDATMLALVALFIGVYSAVTLTTNPNVTIETIIIRSAALAAVVMLHLVLCIGPLCRLSPKCMPLLYNRRHLGVTTFLFGLIHAVFATVQFHTGGAINPLASVLLSYGQEYWPASFTGLAHFPFEPFGAFALAVLFLMAATSHDFWLRNLGPQFWKLMHVLVYAAYGALLVHMAYGILQTERNLLYPVVMGAGFVIVLGLHLAAYRKGTEDVQAAADSSDESYVPVCSVADIPAARGRTIRVDGERIAVFRHNNRLYALANVCRHQGGPIGEGRIIDDCVTCPWHGWQYDPATGKSPPPFNEVVATYPVTIRDGVVRVSTQANPLGTEVPGAPIEAE